MIENFLSNFWNSETWFWWWVLRRDECFKANPRDPKSFSPKSKDFCINWSTVREISEGEQPVLYTAQHSLGRQGRRANSELCMISMKDVGTSPRDGYEPCTTFCPHPPLLSSCWGEPESGYEIPRTASCRQESRNRTQWLWLAKRVIDYLGTAQPQEFWVKYEASLEKVLPRTEIE